MSYTWWVKHWNLSNKYSIGGLCCFSLFFLDVISLQSFPRNKERPLGSTTAVRCGVCLISDFPFLLFFPCELLEFSSFTTPLSSYVLPILLCIVVEQEGTAIWGLPEIRVTVRIISHIWIVTVCSELCSVVVFMCSFPKSKFCIIVSSNVPQRQYTGSCLGVISLGPVMSFYPFSLLFPNVCSSHCRTSWRL